MAGTVLENSLAKSISPFLIVDKASQVLRMWGISSMMVEQALNRRQVPVRLLDQCLPT